MNLQTMSEEEVKAKLEDMILVFNSMQQHLFKLKEKIGLFQSVLLEKQRERIMTANVCAKMAVRLEKETGLSKEQLLKAISILAKEQR